MARPPQRSCGQRPASRAGQPAGSRQPASGLGLASSALWAEGGPCAQSPARRLVCPLAGMFGGAIPGRKPSPQHPAVTLVWEIQGHRGEGRRGHPRPPGPDWGWQRLRPAGVEAGGRPVCLGVPDPPWPPAPATPYLHSRGGQVWGRLAWRCPSGRPRGLCSLGPSLPAGDGARPLGSLPPSRLQGLRGSGRPPGPGAPLGAGCSLGLLQVGAEPAESPPPARPRPGMRTRRRSGGGRC